MQSIFYNMINCFPFFSNNPIYHLLSKLFFMFVSRCVYISWPVTFWIERKDVSPTQTNCFYSQVLQRLPVSPRGNVFHVCKSVQSLFIYCLFCGIKSHTKCMSDWMHNGAQKYRSLSHIWPMTFSENRISHTQQNSANIC